jgi:hypothetical protein
LKTIAFRAFQMTQRMTTLVVWAAVWGEQGTTPQEPGRCVAHWWAVPVLATDAHRAAPSGGKFISESGGAAIGV